MTQASAPITERRYLLPFILVTSLFFLWSIGVHLNDVLIPHFKKLFDLSDFQSSFIQLAFFGMSSGQSFLEVGANPYVTILGPPESSERRLNFAQSFNAVGAVLVLTMGSAFILSGVEHTAAQRAAMSAQEVQSYIASEADMVRVPYLVITSIFLLVAALI